MLTRQKIIVRLLSRQDNGCTKLQLMKLCFLLRIEAVSDQIKTFYEFLPYKHGPYSFGLAHELESLIRDQVIFEAGNYRLALTKLGMSKSKEPLDTNLASDVSRIQKNYGNLEQSDLIDFVYQKHPWFTSKCETVKKRRASIKLAIPANYTCGYQGLHVDGLLNSLLQSGIVSLIDTRSNPVSRRYGFHKSTLSRLCESVGIKYSHFPEVGVPSSWRQELTTIKEYSLLFERYEREVLGTQVQFLHNLASQVSKEPSALLCKEEMPEQCHRTTLARHLSSLNKLPVTDITHCKHNSHPNQESLFSFNSILLS